MNGLPRAIRRLQFSVWRYVALTILAAAGSWTAVQVAAELVPAETGGPVAEISLNGVTVLALVLADSEPGSGISVDPAAGPGVETPEGVVFPLVSPPAPGAQALQVQGPLRIVPTPAMDMELQSATGPGSFGGGPARREAGSAAAGDDPAAWLRILLGLAVAVVSAALWALLCSDLPDPADVASLQRLGMTRRQALSEWRWLVWLMAILGLGLASLAGLVAGVGGLLATDVFLLAAALFVHGAGASVAIQRLGALR